MSMSLRSSYGSSLRRTFLSNTFKSAASVLNSVYGSYRSFGLFYRAVLCYSIGYWNHSSTYWQVWSHAWSSDWHFFCGSGGASINNSTTNTTKSVKKTIIVSTNLIPFSLIVKHKWNCHSFCIYLHQALLKMLPVGHM